MDAVYVLSQHEYLFLLSLLDPQIVLGIAPPYSGPEEEQAAIEQAFRSLQEKGYITRKQDEISLDPQVESPISTCAFPRYSLIAAYTNAKKEQDIRFIHFSQQAIVEDRVLSSNDRQLTGVATPEQVIARLVQQFHLSDQPAAPGQPCTFPTSTLETARQSVARGEEGVVSQLQQAGMSNVTADSLARSLVSPISNSALAKVSTTEDTLPGLGFGLLESADGLWEIHFVEQDQLNLTPVDATTAIQMLASYIS